MRAFLLTALALSLAPVAVRADEPTTVPFTLLRSGHFIVETKLNGKGPYLLIFDTGAPTMLINNRIAKDAGIITPKTPKPLFAPFGSMGEFKIKSLEVGGVEATDVSAMVMDHPTVDLFSKAFKGELGKPVDGIVGFPFFARFVVEVDYQARKMTFLPNGYKPANVMESMMRSMMAGSSTVNQPKIVGAQGLWGFTVAEDEDDEPGVVVKSVHADTGAAAAGLKAGDRILTLNGRWTDTIPDLHQAAGSAKVGKATIVTVKRGKDELKLTMTPVKGL